MMIQSDGNEEGETLAAVRRGLADLAAGRTQELDDFFDEFLDHVDSLTPDSRQDL